MSVELKRTTNVAWRKWLTTEAGIEGMLYLREKVPDVHKGSSDGIIFDAGRSQGWKDCLDAMADVIGVVEPKQVELENI